MTQGHTSEQSSRSACLKIHQERPSVGEWKLWQRATLMWTTLAGLLRQPLGQWTQPIHRQRRYQYAYRYRRRVWIHIPTTTVKYQEYRFRSSNEPLRQVNRSSLFQDVPPLAQPANVQFQVDHGEWHLIHPGHAVPTPPVPFNRQISTFAEYVSTLEEWERELLQYK